MIPLTPSTENTSTDLTQLLSTISTSICPQCQSVFISKSLKQFCSNVCRSRNHHKINKQSSDTVHKNIDDVKPLQTFIDEDQQEVVRDAREREVKTNNPFVNVPDEREGYKVRAFCTNKKDEIVTTWRRKTETTFDLEIFKAQIKECLLDVTPFTFISKAQPKSVQSQIITIGDTHAGMWNKNPQFGSTWTIERLEERILSLTDHIIDCNELVILFLGDGCDGFDNFTTSRAHRLDQNMGNHDQIIGLVQVFQKFFTILSNFQAKGIVNKIRFISVGESNHSGEMDRVFGTFLSMWLEAKYPLIECQISKKYIDKFESGGKNFVFCHGKDGRNQKHGFPLVLDNKTEIYFRNIFDSMDIKADENTHVISADAHQKCSMFKTFHYHKVGAICSASDWIQTNFSTNISSTTYLKILGNNTIEEGIIHFKN